MSSASATRAFVRIGTFNVHGFYESSSDHGYQRLVDVVRASGVDVVGLEEVSGKIRNGKRLVERLGEDTGLKHLGTGGISFCGNAVLSRYPLTYAGTVKANSPYGDTRQATLTVVNTPLGELPFVVTHLDFRGEPSRVLQWAGFQRWLRTHPLLQRNRGDAADAADAAHPPAGAPTADKPERGSMTRGGVRRPDFYRPPPLDAPLLLPSSLRSHVVVGDLNALCRADYTSAEWAALNATRERGGWEPGQTALMSTVLGVGASAAAPATPAAAPGGEPDDKPRGRRPYYGGPDGWRAVAAEDLDVLRKCTLRYTDALRAAAAAPRCAELDMMSNDSRRSAVAARDAGRDPVAEACSAAGGEAAGGEPSMAEALGKSMSAPGTCRFDTRIDYLLLFEGERGSGEAPGDEEAKGEADERKSSGDATDGATPKVGPATNGVDWRFVPGSKCIVRSSASDHSLVVADVSPDGWPR